MAAARPAAERPQRLVVRDGARVHVIPARQAGLRRGAGRLRGAAQRRQDYLKQQTIANLEATLDPARFVRIHRSAIVNLERVARIEPYGKESRLAILADGTRLPVSRPGYARLLEAMGDSQGRRSDTR